MSPPILFLLAIPVLAQQSPFPALHFDPVAEGIERPTHIASAGDGTGRLFLVEQRGRIRILKDGNLLEDFFLDISDHIACCNEQGLLSVAFPPDYKSKQYFYVFYVNLNNESVVARFQTSAINPDFAYAGSETAILTLQPPFDTHKGGQLAFSPRDGYLYIGIGDGGDGGDPLHNGQNPDVLFGKLLRINVESEEAPYAIPPTNPFVGRDGYRPEIWAVGLRNPWRFSFDRKTGDLYIGDVGQNLYEEIDFQSADSPGGENYGWRTMEGSHCFDPEDCSADGLTPPILDYEHTNDNSSVTGGFVYRGTAYERAQGLYLFGDFSTGRLWGAVRDESGWQQQELAHTQLDISTFGEDEAGEVYFASYSEGKIYRLRLESAE